MADKDRKNVLVTGALGQIGSELVGELEREYGAEHIIATDIRDSKEGNLSSRGPFEKLDVLSMNRMKEVVEKYQISLIYHLAAVLSAIAEKDPQRAWKINMEGLYNALEVSRFYQCSLFVPSSIGAFGVSTPPDGTPQDTIMRPGSMYGVTKVSGELLCDYYHGRFGVDTRGVRYPGIISSVTLPGGGTTDYAVEIFYAAVMKKKYTCYLKKNTSLDMMYMPDAIKAAIDIMQAGEESLIHRNAFNITAMHFTPEQIASEIKKHIPGFRMDYQVDPVRQAIADSWPNYMDDGAAGDEWGWRPQYDLERMTEDMLRKIEEKYRKGLISGEILD